MTSVNVLVTDTFEDECLEMIAAISPNIRLIDASHLLQTTQGIGVPIAKEINPDAKIKLDNLLADAEVIFTHRIPQDLIRRAPHLKWLQLTAAGVEIFMTEEIKASPVIITNTSGMHIVNIGEYVIALMLAFTKKLPLYFQQKQRKQWKRFPPPVLRSHVVGIVGLGHIGREVARLAKAFGMKVIANRRSSKQAERNEYVDTMFAQEQLGQLLAESDFVVLTLPLTDETRQLIGEKEIHAMKSTAFLINIARGAVVDEDALIRALEEKWIAGAGLDVYATEPLPVNSPLWKLPNVILTPHIAGSMNDFNKRATEFFLENLRQYLGGRKLRSVVNKERGY